MLMKPDSIKQLFSNGLHEECLQICQRLLRSEPENVVAWKYSGKSYLALGQLKQSHQCLLKAHEIDDNDPEIIQYIGDIFLKTGKSDDAMAWFERAIKIDSNHCPTIYTLANLKSHVGHNQEAFLLCSPRSQMVCQCSWLC